MAFASVLYPERFLAAELANPEPTGSSQQRTPRGLRTITELFRPGASSVSYAASRFTSVVRPWWSASPFTSPAAAAAAAASAKDKAVIAGEPFKGIEGGLVI